MTTATDATGARRAIDAWARSGAMTLTGRSDGPPLGPPAPLPARLAERAAVIERHAAANGRSLSVDPLALLAERAALADLRRGGRVTCGGGGRLLEGTDGWLAVNLPRPDDLELLPAWLETPLDTTSDDLWDRLTREVNGRSVWELDERGALLGLPVGAVPPTPPTDDPATQRAPRDPADASEQQHADRGSSGTSSPADDRSTAPSARFRPLVIDLSSLWAGPLCSSLLAAAGADVVKVESTGRPDGARRGEPAFFDLLHAGKRSVALDLGRADGRRRLAELVARADVVVESSRPRALRQLGIVAEEVVASSGSTIWVSITGHGRGPDVEHRVGFGDDAAAAGGLVAWDGDRPLFCADAVADPATGITAAAATLDALAGGGNRLLDVSLVEVARELAGPTLAVPADVVAGPPTARRSTARARPLGADTDDVLDDLGIR